MNGPSINDFAGQLPFIYANEVRNQLNDLSYSLDVMITPERTMGDESEREKYQAHRQEYVDQHRFWSYVPYRLSIGNTYNVMPFASADFSTTNIKASSNSSSKSSKEEKKEEMSALTRGIIFAIGSFALYKAAEGIGFSIGELNAANQDLSKIAKIKPFVDQTQGQMNNMNLCGQTRWLTTEMQTLQDIINDRFFSQVKNNALQNLMLKVGVAFSALIVMTGALIASKAVIVGGVLLGILAGTGLVIKYSIAKNDPTIKQAATELQRKIQNFVINLNGVPNRKFEVNQDMVFTRDNQAVFFVSRPEQSQYGAPNPDLHASAPAYGQ